MIPNGIENTHLARAVAEIKRDGIPPRRKSVHYDYVHSGKHYPPKYVISLAARFALGRELSSSKFTAVEARDYLKSRGYTVIDRRAEALAKIQPEDDESAFNEGAAFYRKHRFRERDPLIAEKAKAKRLAASGVLACEICSFDFVRAYGEMGSGFIEAHHTVPIAKLDGKSKTKICDLALVCSNCHRMLHRQKDVMTVQALRKFLRTR
jgi:predicted HNH restriction endonuclease